jgi:ribokinase
MTVYNLGSINIDHVYRVPHLPGPGETLAAATLLSGLGGKGANQSVAAALAGATTHHIGAIGPDGAWVLASLTTAGVDVSAVARAAVPTGHAIINVDDHAENAIVLFTGANAAQDRAAISRALSAAQAGDTLMLQNETTEQAFAARLAAEKGLRVVYSAAPFDVDAVRAVLAFTTMIVVNEIEAAQLCAALKTTLTDLPVAEVLVTKGAKGAEWHVKGAAPLSVASFKVQPVDTTGAGDCFIGSLVAALDLGQTRAQALRYASAAAAISVTRAGAASSMAPAAEVQAFLRDHPQA